MENHRVSLFVSPNVQRETFSKWEEIFHPYLDLLYKRLQPLQISSNQVSYHSFCSFVYRYSSGHIPELFLTWRCWSKTPDACTSSCFSFPQCPPVRSDCTRSPVQRIYSGWNSSALSKCIASHYWPRSRHVLGRCARSIHRNPGPYWRTGFTFLAVLSISQVLFLCLDRLLWPICSWCPYEEK